MTDLNQKIYVAGHQGMVGSAIVRALKKHGYSNIIGRTHKELDLTNQIEVNQFFEQEKPTQVFLAAAKVGGIHANNAYPAEFIYENLMIEANVIHAAWMSGVQKLLFLGSSCIYPKEVSQPMFEDTLLTGKLESTNEPYAIAKITGIKLCESYNRQYGVDYRSIMPTNLYGSGDNYHPENSHVIPALIRRFNEAKESNAANVIIWGSGKARREFLYVDDMAEACLFLMHLDMQTYKSNIAPMESHINVGSGLDISINDLAILLKKIVGFDGEILFDTSKPNGTFQKLMNSQLINRLGWHAKIDLEQGLKKANDDFKNHYQLLRK
jgi:GDP-L-fucose synthase